MPQKAKRSKCAYCSERATLTVTAPFATPVPCCDAHRRSGWLAGDKAVKHNVLELDLMAYDGRWDRLARPTPNWRKPSHEKRTDHILGGGPRFAAKKV